MKTLLFLILCVALHAQPNPDQSRHRLPDKPVARLCGNWQFYFVMFVCAAY